MIRNTIRNTIQNTIRNTLGDDAFNMLDLFSGGQRGVWYDPSDLATMYQESTGTTAVTADGQPVGLMLDKSRGELFGDELVTNGTFDSDTSGWTANNTTLSVISGKLKVENSSAIYGNTTTPITLQVGKQYVLSFDFTKTSNAVLAFNTVSGGGSGTRKAFITLDSSGSYSLTWTADTASMYVAATVNSAAAGAYFELDNVSVREVLGTTATQPVATKRPTYKDTPDRLEIDLVDDALLFDVPTGGIDGYMVVGTNDGTASYGVSLPAGSYELGGDYFPSNTINGFLLREGAVSKSDLAKVEKDFVSKGAKASYGDVTNFSNYWRDNNLTSFPLVDTSSGTSFFATWYNNNLTSFPLIDTSSGTSFFLAWYNNNLTSFPLIDTSNVTSFSYAWWRNNLTSFPLIDTSNGTSFQSTWRDNTALADFPVNMFDNCLATNFEDAFTNTGLTQASIDGILVSINSNGTSNGIFDQSGGSAPSAAGEAAIDAMRSRGWTITVTGGY